MTFPTQLSETPATGNPTRTNEALDTLHAFATYLKRQEATTGLTWGYWGGRWSGFSVSDGTLTLTNAADNYVVVERSSGTISVSTATTNWNNVGSYARVYKITTAGSVVTAVESHYAGAGGAHGSASSSINVQSVTSAGTVTPTFANDLVRITAQAAALDLANPSGAVVEGWGIVIRIKDDGTARAITYGTQYRAIGVTLPTTTVISKTLYLACIWNDTDTKLDVVAVGQEA